MKDAFGREIKDQGEVTSIAGGGTFSVPLTDPYLEGDGELAIPMSESASGVRCGMTVRFKILEKRNFPRMDEFISGLCQFVTDYVQRYPELESETNGLLLTFGKQNRKEP